MELGKQRWRDLDMTLVRVTHIVVAVQVALGVLLYILFLIEGGRGRSIGGFTGGHVVPALLAYGGVLFAAIRARKASSWPDKFRSAAIGLIAAIILIFGALMSVGGIFCLIVRSVMDLCTPFDKLRLRRSVTGVWLQSAITDLTCLHEEVEVYHSELFNKASFCLKISFKLTHIRVAFVLFDNALRQLAFAPVCRSG